MCIHYTTYFNNFKFILYNFINFCTFNNIFNSDLWILTINTYCTYQKNLSFPVTRSLLFCYFYPKNKLTKHEKKYIIITLYLFAELFLGIIMQLCFKSLYIFTVYLQYTVLHGFNAHLLRLFNVLNINVYSFRWEILSLISI